jgi:predicted ribosome quality control (RQC) complex YloA/Tae2 family protein
MKTETRIIQGLGREITFYIGKTQAENFDVIDKGNPDDLWFHAKSDSSCHVVCLLPDPAIFDLEEREMRMIIKKGAELCKQNTHKLSGLHNVPIMYTELRNITKTKTAGLVLTKNTKTIIV